MRWKTAGLSHAASNLLLAIIQARAEGIEEMRAGEWKAEAGIRKHQLWERAITELNTAGLARLSKRGQLYTITNLTVFNGSFRETERQRDRESNEIDISIYRTTDAKPVELDEPDPFLSGPGTKNSPTGLKLENGPTGLKAGIDELENGPTGLNYGKNSPTGPKSKIVLQDQNPENSPGGLKRECVEADLLDDSGDLGRANSPSQYRRRQQVAVVQKTWQQFVGAELFAQNAKHFLAHLDNSAEAVYDFVEWLSALKKDNPLAYGKKVLENRERERPQLTPPFLPVFVPGPVDTYDPAEQARVDRAAREARVKHWRRLHPNVPVPADL